MVIAVGFKGQIIDFFKVNNWKLQKEIGTTLIFKRLYDERVIEVKLKFQ